MNNDIENPEAFPILDPNGSFWNPGMSLRDYFAGQVLTGLLANQYTYSDGRSAIAERCYEVADSMLKERMKYEE